MKSTHLAQWAIVGIVALGIAVSATSQSQKRGQSTAQRTVKTLAVVDPLVEWKTRYAMARQVASEITKSDSSENGARLENDLTALDSALREYVRVSENLRHKNRALSDTIQFLVLQNNIQQQSRQYQTISNALTASHQVESGSIRNMK